MSGGMAFGLQDTGVARGEILSRVERNLKRLEIGAYRDKNPLDLSGGQIQRVAIVSISAMEPEILAPDEPTSRLDPQGSEDVFRTVDRLVEPGVTIVMAGYKMEKLVSYCHRLPLLHNGEQAVYDTPGRIFARGDLKKLGVEPPVCTWVSRALSVDYPERNLEVGQECYLVTLEQILVLREYFPTQL